MFGIVVTTIYDGAFIDAYYEHFDRHGRLEDARFYVVGDLTTPADCAERVRAYTRRGLPWFFLTPDDQEAFLADFPELAAEIPWRSDNRRNVGFLMAYRDGCDPIISIDDDNYPTEGWDFLGEHAVVGREVTLRLAVGDQGWFNLCSMMAVRCPSLGGGQTVYPRGFPYPRRTLACGTVSDQLATGQVAINAGLWSGDPDVDAATRLVTRCATSENFTESYLLGRGVRSPINTQNTALMRAALPAYYYVKMGVSLAGLKLDRFGDIFSGYFVQKCAEAVGHWVRVGSPVVEHRRTPHNLYVDLWHELAGMVVLDDMLPLLETPLTPASDYGTAALELADRIEAWAAGQKGFLWSEALQGYFQNVAANLRRWVAVCRQLD
ncbi:MAG: hypothetical protein SNJ67_04890 [Chloracidobacterium sp.]|uniref:Reversibly glycosylated polypeptide n=1 Tax=Chloracidobacterium validum TaxID=2821543 RepID=A0ABX8BAF2_9BACT|nr:hypothetical protein [Chloracidobacterium validum]QUW03646.1 hypothetical protein J8C06_04205 [Chloracidobacterium validum]